MVGRVGEKQGWDWEELGLGVTVGENLGCGGGDLGQGRVRVGAGVRL